MTIYCIIGTNGRILEEIESDKSVEELAYDLVDGSRVANIVRKQDIPPDANMKPVGRPTEAAGCMGYEEGLRLDKMLGEGSQPLLEGIEEEGQEEN